MARRRRRRYGVRLTSWWVREVSREQALKSPRGVVRIRGEWRVFLNGAPARPLRPRMVMVWERWLSRSPFRRHNG